MTEELTPEFLKFSEMLDSEENPEFEGEQANDAQVLSELGEALREEPASLPEGFAAETAAGVVRRFESLSPMDKRQRWLERRLLAPVSGLKGLAQVTGLLGSLGLLGFWKPELLWLLGPLLLVLSGGWGVHFLLNHEVWGLGSHDSRVALFQRLGLAFPLLAGAFVVINGGWQLGALMENSVDSKALGSGLTLLAMSPVLGWLNKAVKALLSRTSRPRLAFGGILVVSFGVCGRLAWSWLELSNNQHWHLYAIIGLLATALALSSVPYFPADCWSENPNAPLFKNLEKRLFYALPVCNALTTGVLVGGLTYFMGVLSLSFRNDAITLTVLAAFLALSLIALIINASFRYWEAVLAQARQQPRMLLRFQTLQVVWGATQASVLLTLVNSHADPVALAVFVTFVLATLALAAGAAILVGEKSYTSKLSLKEARKKGALSVVFGLVPIALSVVAFYQINLTREIQDPSYQYVVQDVKGWHKQLSEIPEEKNGWLVLRPYMLKPEVEKAENAEVAKAFTAPIDFVWGDPNDYLGLRKRDQLGAYLKQKKLFLSCLPLLKKAMSKPYFSYAATEGNRVESLVPNFIACRAISQSFDLLFQEEVYYKNSESALHWAELGLNWGSKLEPGSLIGLMIRVAQLSISHQHLEEQIVSGFFDSAELRRLSLALREARMKPQMFAEAMKRETMMCDSAFDLILSGKEDVGDLAGSEEALAIALRVMPRSYWESERKAYWNNQLSQSHRWHSLALTGDTKIELSPFNIASELLIPNINRAQLQFCYHHSKYSALILVCELERHKLDHGYYPETLESLVPEYLSELPEDLMRVGMVGKKGGFEYQKTTDGYLLKSNSAAYSGIGLKTLQVYGHDGRFEERRENL